MIDEMAAATVVDGSTPWDPAAFADALRAVRATDRSLAATAEVWLREIPVQQRDLLARQLGVPGLAKLADLSFL
jgi:hypothetical protein